MPGILAVFIRFVLALSYFILLLFTLSYQMEQCFEENLFGNALSRISRRHHEHFVLSKQEGEEIFIYSSPKKLFDIKRNK